MTHAELVEKVALVIVREYTRDPNRAVNSRDEEIARAALTAIAEALRVPCDAMTMAGGKAMIPESVNNTADAYWNANACWRAMLAASPLVQEDKQ